MEAEVKMRGETEFAGIIFIRYCTYMHIGIPESQSDSVT